jgi:hypothetical protein
VAYVQDVSLLAPAVELQAAYDLQASCELPASYEVVAPRGQALLSYTPAPLAVQVQSHQTLVAPVIMSVPAVSRRRLTQVETNPAPLLDEAELRPWLEAARDFELNTDFDLQNRLYGLNGHIVGLEELMATMKEESGGKRTIQALADKLMLHRLLDNLGVPQLPNVFTVDHIERANVKEVDDFVNTYLVGDDAIECVLKPTHLSNASGVLSLSKVPPDEHEQAVTFVAQHMQEYMGRKAGDHESIAMRSLIPGFVVQPKYKSVVGFDTPLELRIVVLWGKARLAVWWWGRSDSPGENPNRNAWLVRRPRRPGEISRDDHWQVIHNHVGHNPGFDKALELFERHISTMAITAEAVATAFGAPFLRIDFFVGNPRWGIRLNEVAYGCGCDYRNITDDGIIFNDAQAVSQIILEGMQVCQKCFPPEYFLSRLGMFGGSYAQSSISNLKSSLRPPLPAGALDEESELQSSRNCWDCRVPDHLCKTSRDFQDESSMALQQDQLGQVPSAGCYLSSASLEIKRSQLQGKPKRCQYMASPRVNQMHIRRPSMLRTHLLSTGLGACMYPPAIQAHRQPYPYL